MRVAWVTHDCNSGVSDASYVRVMDSNSLKSSSTVYMLAIGANVDRTLIWESLIRTIVSDKLKLHCSEYDIVQINHEKQVRFKKILRNCKYPNFKFYSWYQDYLSVKIIILVLKLIARGSIYNTSRVDLSWDQQTLSIIRIFISGLPTTLIRMQLAH